MAALLLAATSLTACVSPTPRADGTYTAPIGGAPVINNETQYSNQLRCIGGLLATAVMGVPAWRQIDLLPVMTAGGDDEDDADPDDDDDADGAPGRAAAADAVEALFDRNAATPA